MPKFFIDKESVNNNKAKICGGDVTHIAKVLRLPVGSNVTLCDGDGTDYEAQITEIRKDAVMLDIISTCICDTEPKVKVTLFQGIPKASKMEYIIQKCTELGVISIVPVMTKRTVVKLENAQAEKKKLERWNKISAEAVKQCGRGYIPKVCDVAEINSISAKDFDLLLVAYEEETDISLKSVLKNNNEAKNIGIVIGPEGGLEKSEVEHLIKSGAKSVTLGKRILRTETAGHTVLTAVLYELGELE
ncbi:MAG: 16S rRNA (uracil(1498)-N(3))-methyltransferase [Clostridia bacterium]|nr:16S rRNA (uracil(1498)-N(3))-methyltransferase [Clostridia bacterium]